MLIIGLDISNTSTGMALYNDGVISHTEVIKGPDMLKAIKDRLDFVISSVEEGRELPVLVTENFTSTLTGNDRTGSADRLISLRASVIEYVTDEFGIKTASFNPWSWRRYFGLYTRVTSDKSPKFNKLARVIGHDILKEQSLEYVQRNSEKLGLSEKSDISKINDDEAEAVLLINAFIQSGGSFNDTTQFFKQYELKADDVYRLFEELDELEHNQSLVEYI